MGENNLNWGSVIPLAGNVIDAVAGGINAQQQFKNQMKLQKDQQDFNVQMWNKNNEYNSPANQLSLYEQAGLNPNYYMTQGAAGNAQAPTSSQGSASMAHPTRFSEGFNMLMQGMNYDLERTVERKSLELKEKELQILDKNKTRELDIQDKKTQSEVDLNTILGDEHTSKKELNEAESKKIAQDIVESQKRVDEMVKNIDLLAAKKEEAEALAYKYRQEGDFVAYNSITERIKANASRVTADATKELYEHYGKKADSEVELNEQSCRNLVEQLQNVKKDGRLKDIDIKYKGKQYQADIDLKNGQVESVKIKNWVDGNAKYADVASRYVTVVDQTAQCVSHGAEAALDVYSFGTSAKLGKLFGKGGKQTVTQGGSHRNPNFWQTTSTTYGN